MSHPVPSPRIETVGSNEQVAEGRTTAVSLHAAPSTDQLVSGHHDDADSGHPNPTASSTAPPTSQASRLHIMGGTYGSVETATTGEEGFVASSADDWLPPGDGAGWDWANAMNFADFSTLYEPQAQLGTRAGVQMHGPFLHNITAPYQGPATPNSATTIAGPTAVYASVTAPYEPSVAANPQNTHIEQAFPSTAAVLASSAATDVGKKRKQDSEPLPVNPNDTEQPGPSASKRISIRKPSQPDSARRTVGRYSGSNSQPAAHLTHASSSRASSDAESSTAIPDPRQRVASTNSKQSSTLPQKDKTSLPIEPQSKPVAEGTEKFEERRSIAGIPESAINLPSGKVFPIQIGSELFRLSGASISSDAPSYFSHYFGNQLLYGGGHDSALRTLYIDRDPRTFRDIALHLQGYHIRPRDGEHFVRLFADAQFYSLPRLTQQLFKSDIYVQIGDGHFRISRELFSCPGDSPNFFSLGFAHFFSTPKEVFPGLDRQSLLRPPSLYPPLVPNRSGDVFRDLIRLLQGYDPGAVVRDEGHRTELLRDARYFHLRGVEQKLLQFSLSYNLLRQRNEITLRLEDIRQSGVGFSPDPASPHVFNPPIPSRDSGNSKPATPLSTSQEPGVANGSLAGYISYQRPFIDESASELIIEISGPIESTRLDVSAMRATFTGPTRARIASLFQVVANKLNLPARIPLGLMLVNSGGGVAAQPVSPANSGVSGDRVRIRIGRDSCVELDGRILEWDEHPAYQQPIFQAAADRLPPIRRRTQQPSLIVEEVIFEPTLDWVIQRGQWRLRVEGTEDDPANVEVIMCAVRLEGYTTEWHRNSKKGFL